MASYYMPIYFQAIRHATPSMSGVYILPAILSQIVFAAVSGALGMTPNPMPCASCPNEFAAIDRSQLADSDTTCPGALPAGY